MVETLPPDPYHALGLSKDATDAEIRKAYKTNALRTHPDKASNKNPATVDEFHRIQQAYELLTDPDKKQKYEDSLRFSRRRGEPMGRKPGFARSSTGPSQAPPPFSRSSTMPGNASPNTGHSRENSGDARRATDFGGPPRGPFNPDSYSAQERRPRQSSYDPEPAYTPRHTEDFPAQEPVRNTSRKYDGYERSTPKTSSRTKEAPRATSRQEQYTSSKPSPREREYAKKQRDQEVRRERQSNVAPEFKTDSDSDPGYEERYRPPPNTFQKRGVRPRSPDSGTDSREDMYTDRHAGVMHDRMNASREYMFGKAESSKPDRMPMRSYRHEAFGSYEGSPEPESRKTSRTANGFVRRTSYKPPEQEPRSGGRSRAASLAENKKSVPSSRGFNEPPSLSHSSSSPATGAKLANMASSRRARAVSDEDEPPAPKMGIRRSETMPMRPSPARTGSYKSELRRPPDPYQQDAKNDDSGYSTSNSPSEEQNEYMPSGPKTTSYAYPATKKTSSSDRMPRVSPYADDVPEFRNTDYRGSSARYPTNTPVAEVRASGSSRMRDSPSPHSRDRRPAAYPAPPVSRSASFNPPRDSDREAPSVSRRPSLSRQGSTSRRESGSGTPSLPRTNSGGPALHLNTKNLRSEGSGQLFGEVPMYSSPVDYHANSSGPESGRDTRRRPSEDLRAPSGSSRSTRKVDPKTRDAKKYMDRDRAVVEERAPRGSRMRAAG